MSAEQEVEALVDSISGHLWNVAHLPEWMQIPALGRDTRPLLLPAARAVLDSGWLAERDAQVRAEATAAVEKAVEAVESLSVLVGKHDEDAMARDAYLHAARLIRAALTLDAGAALRAREAKALRDAADAWAGGEWRAVNFNRAGRDEHPGMRQARWLRERADALEAGES